MPRLTPLTGVLAQSAAYGLFMVSLVLCSVVNLWFVKVDVPLGFDEGYIGAIALRLLDGNMLPGVDGVGQRGPVFYWVAALTQWLGDRHHWIGFRVLSWLAASAVMLALLGLGVLCRRPLAGAIGASVYLYTLGHQFGAGAGLSVNGEQIAAPLLCGATLLAGVATCTKCGQIRNRYAIFAGVLAAIAGWTKVTLLASVVPLAAWLLLSPGKNAGGSLRARLTAPIPLILGWLLPTLLILALYSTVGQLDQFVYRFFTYNREIYMGVYADASVWLAVKGWLTGGSYTAWMALGCVGALFGYAAYLAALSRTSGLVGALSSTAVVLVMLLHAGLAFASATAQMRFWPHHFVVAVPWAGMLLGLGVDGLLRFTRPRMYALLALSVTVAVSAGLVATVGRDAHQRERERLAGHWRPAYLDARCRVIQQYSGPEESIFVWGFDGDLYVSCARRPATRFVYMTFVAGIVPPFWSQARPERVARNAVQETLRDLETVRPALIIDLPSKLKGVRVTHVFELRELIRQDYCEISRSAVAFGGDARLYARREGPHCAFERAGS